MNIILMTVPGRFPTVVRDPGPWWSAVSALDGYETIHFSTSASWWRALCSPLIAEATAAGLTWTQRVLRHIVWRARGINLQASANLAARSLCDLCSFEVYQSQRLYIQAVSGLAEHLEAVNAAQHELWVSLCSGPRVRDLDYGNSATLVNYANRDTCLSSLVGHALTACPTQIGLLLVYVNSPEELLSAMIIGRQLRKKNPGMYFCLADHGYENFSLHPHMDQLKDSGALLKIFDGIIVSKDDRDVLVPALAKAVVQGIAPRGFLLHNSLAPETFMPRGVTAPPPVPTFASEAILWTRVSQRRCYWSHCTFCVQNAKYDDPRSPSLVDLSAMLDRIKVCIDEGYKTFIFSDEALSPALLRNLCRGILDRGLSFRWACRCKMELSHTHDLFQLMKQAGCYEILYGLESVSPRMQKRMGKFAEGLDAARMKEIIQMMNQAGIGIHVNLIAGFPGDTAAESLDSVRFVIDALAEFRGATFTLNRFALFPDTPVARNPQAFGVVPIVGQTDMPAQYEYSLIPELAAEACAVNTLIPRLRHLLMMELGWTSLGEGPGCEAAVELYFGSGHGSIFKSQEYNNPFANPRLQPKENLVAQPWQ